MPTANTIDVSRYQSPSLFDYAAAKSAGIKTIIIQSGHGLSQDPAAAEHIANAKKYGLNWHLYHYFEEKNGEYAFAVQNAINLGMTAHQVLFLDMEGELKGNWATEFNSFYESAKSHFKVGLYCSDSPYKSYFDNTKLVNEDVIRWIASYSYEPKNYDIWQMSGNGSGGFGSYKNDVDRDYDPRGVLVVGSNPTPITPTPQVPMYRPIVLEYGTDTESNIYGRGYSYDNGKTFHVTDTMFGRKYRQEDADRLYPFFKKYITGGGTATSIAWKNITDKPDVALKSDIPTTIDWKNVTNAPDISKIGGSITIDKSQPTNMALPNAYSEGIKYELKKLDTAIPGSGIKADYVVIATKTVVQDKSHLCSQIAFALGTQRPYIWQRVGTDAAWYGWELDTTWGSATNQDSSGGVTGQVHWADVLDKPQLALKSDLPDMTKYATKDDLTKATIAPKITATVENVAVSEKPSVAFSNKDGTWSFNFKLPLNQSGQSESSLKVTTLKSGSDLASLDTGLYEIDYSPKDLPGKLQGICKVIAGTSYTEQIFTDVEASVFVRIKSGSAFSAWRQITAWN